MHITNPGAAQDVDLYVLLQVLDDFWCYPSWQNISQGLDQEALTVGAGMDEDRGLIPQFSMPAVSSFGPLYFYAAMFEPGTVSLETLVSNGAAYEFYLGE